MPTTIEIKLAVPLKDKRFDKVIERIRLETFANTGEPTLRELLGPAILDATLHIRSGESGRTLDQVQILFPPM